MESIGRENAVSDLIYINERGQRALQRAGYWGRFLAVIGFISATLTILGGLFMFLAGSLAGDAAAELPLPLVGGIYLASGLITFFASLYLWQFADKTDLAIKTDDSDLLSEGLHKLMIVMRFLGLTVIIAIGLVVLGVVAVFMMSLLSL